MKVASSRLRAFFAVLTAVVVVVLYLSFGEKPNSAQQQAPAQPLKGKFQDYSTADEVTAAIRDNSRDLVRVQYHSMADYDNLSRYGKVVENYGSFAVVSRKKTTDLSRSGMDVQQLDSTVNLPGEKFEPLGRVRSESVKPGAESAEGGYYIVQLGGIAKDEWLDSLRDAGVEILQYVPHQAFFVYGDGAAIARVANHSRVRWVGGYLPEQKLSPELAKFARGVKGETAMFDVAVFKRANLADSASVVASAIRGRILHQIELPNNFFNVVRIEASPDDLAAISRIPDVFRIDAYEKPQAEDERAAQIVAGNFTSTTVLNAPGYNPLAQFGVNGQNVTVSVVDDGVSIPGNGGFYITAGNTVNGPLRGAPAGAFSGHGHLNASIIAGDSPFGNLDPTNYNYALGVAPKSNIINIPLLVSGYMGTEVNIYNDTVTTAGPNGVLGSISNNSWGNGTNSNTYDSYAAQFDGFVRDASAAPTIDPISLIFSAGNLGAGQTLTKPKTAKNLIAVGNSENIRTELGSTNADNIDDLTGSSSRGPTADGRIKPDIVAPGTVITGSRAGACNVTGSPVCFEANHSWSTGTSHAAPQVAGAAALFTQLWKNAFGGTNPSPALIKAAVINSGQEMNGAITNTATIPNGNEGWGRINMKNMFNASFPIAYVNEGIAFSNPGDSVAITGSVIDVTKPVRFTLVWTDPPGVADPALVNNLDLTVTVGGNTYRGNVFSGGVSVTGGSNSTIDNVENVFLAPGISRATAVSINITATALNGDGILGNGDTTDQHFALVAYNFTQPALIDRKPPVDFDGDDKTDVSIFRNDMSRWWVFRSSDSVVFGTALGTLGEAGTPVPADYTGDGKADVANWGSTGTWYIQRSEDFSYFTVPFGTSGDKPVPADYDGDGKVDRAVFRPSVGTWYIEKTSGGVDIIPWGNSTDRPVPADYDGDGKADIAIFRPSSGQWWINRSTAGVIVLTFGVSTDRNVQGDYTGDGKADIAVWRPSTGEWFVLRSEDFSYYSVPFGTSSDLPAPGDYDGDDKFDPAVYRPSTATWYVNRSAAGIYIQTFGLSTDVPLPYAYVP